MTVFPRFIFPHAFALLPLILFAVYLGWRISFLGPVRKWTAITIRSLLLLALIMALAGAEMVRKNDRLAVFFLLDSSNSIPLEVAEAAKQSILASAKMYMKDDDMAGLIVFGEDASIELRAEEAFEFDAVYSTVGGEHTDLAAAMRLAMAAFPKGHMRRMVIYSDGNETRGSALEEAKLAQAAGIEVDVVPLTIGGGNEVRIREVRTPSHADADEPFQVEVVVRSDEDAQGTLRLSRRWRDNVSMLAEQAVTLQQGDNVFLITQELVSPGFVEYEATIESSNDSVLANNAGSAYTMVYGEPRVLHVARVAEDARCLTEALRQEGVDVQTAEPGELPSSLPKLRNYDAVILTDVSRRDLSIGQMNAVEAMVRDLGIGLVVVGGVDTFGAGDLKDTPIERALPVSMDLTQRKVLPSCALMLIIDKSGSMAGEKVQMAKQAAIASARLLSSMDYIGVIGFDGEPYWVVGLQLAANKGGIIEAIGTIGPGGGTEMYPAMVQAYNALANTPTNLKHCIVLSDGRSQPGNFAGIVAQMADKKITVSTVGVGSDADHQLLSNMARLGGGRYYYTDNPSAIPQFFTKEALIIRKNMLIEEEFTPAQKHESELLRGVMSDGLPILRGYVVTTPKDASKIALVSHDDDPVLAHWRFGLGKSVAFTSDATSRWAAEWLKWDGFNRFWAQTVRWAMRDTQRSGFRVETRREADKGVICIDAVDAEGQFVNFLRLNAVITGPAPDFEKSVIELAQTGPGIYEATFPADKRGVYMINTLYNDAKGNEGVISAGLSVGYSPEYEVNTTNRALLERVAEVGAGDVKPLVADFFENDMQAATTVTAVWQWLVAFAACILPLDVFVRRVMIDFSRVYLLVAAALRALPGLRRYVPIPQFATATATGTYGTLQARRYTYERRGNGALEGDPGAPPRDASPDMTGVPGEESTGPGKSEYTRQLLAAKRRALSQRRKGS